MRVFTKKSPDPSRASSSFHRSLPPHRRLGASTSPPDPSQLDVAHPERFASSTDSLLHILQSRASSLASPHLLPLHLHSSLVHALDFERHLVGHEGCVNRLAFNPSATLLASGSDDCTVRLWSLTRPLGPPLLTLETGHTANIFAVGFLKADRAIVSAGMDMDVRVCDVDTQQRLEVFRCHPNRVKELCVDPSNDRIFLTSGEDGSCRQVSHSFPTSHQTRAAGPPLLTVLCACPLLRLPASSTCASPTPARFPHAPGAGACSASLASPARTLSAATRWWLTAPYR